MSSSKNIQGKLIDTGTVVSTKTIQCRLSLEFGLKLCKAARKPRLTEAMKKNVWTLPKDTLTRTQRSGKGYFFLTNLL